MTSAPEPPALSDSEDRAGHLDWCLPAFCETLDHPGGTETRHLSAPLVWSMTGDAVDVVMRRLQVRDVDGLDAATVEVHLSHRERDEEMVLTLTADDAHRLVYGVTDLLDDA